MTQILVLEGDGIGPEITASTCAVLRHADMLFGLGLEFVSASIGFAALNSSGENAPAISHTTNI